MAHMQWGYDRTKRNLWPGVLPTAIGAHAWSAAGYSIGAPVYIEGNTLVTVIGTHTGADDTASIQAYNKLTGAPIWGPIKLPGTEGQSWPFAISNGIVVCCRVKYDLNALNIVYGLRISDGTVVWNTSTASPTSPFMRYAFEPFLDFCHLFIDSDDHLVIINTHSHDGPISIESANKINITTGQVIWSWYPNAGGAPFTSMASGSLADPLFFFFGPQKVSPDSAGLGVVPTFSIAHFMGAFDSTTPTSTIVNAKRISEQVFTPFWNITHSADHTGGNFIYVKWDRLGDLTRPFLVDLVKINTDGPSLPPPIGPPDVMGTVWKKDVGFFPGSGGFRYWTSVPRIDSFGNVYITDSDNRVKQFAPNGDNTHTFISTAPTVAGIRDVLSDSSGQILIIDKGAKRIDMYRLGSPTPFTSRWNITYAGTDSMIGTFPAIENKCIYINADSLMRRFNEPMGAVKDPPVFDSP